MLAQLLVATVLLECSASILSPNRLLRFRGGREDKSEEDKFAQQLKLQGSVGPLRREELVEKLNTVPTFCVLQEDGSVISLPDQDGGEGDEVCTWFLDAAEAKLLLRRVVAANPDLQGLRLESHGLGDVLTMTDAWPRKAAEAVKSRYDAPRLKLQGLREVISAVGGQLVTALQTAGLDPGSWQVAVFIAEELAQATPEGTQIRLPVFLSPHDVQAAYARAGIPPSALERVQVLELRQLLQLMSEATPDAVNPWRATQFIAPPAALKFAQELAK